MNGKDVASEAEAVQMARAYAGVLGLIALCFEISRGLLLDGPVNAVLSQSLVVFFCFSLIGFLIGSVADKTIRESVENRFRSEMASLQSAAASADSETPE